MIEYTLNIGEVATSTEKATYTCLGLGSCVGLFIQDRISGHSGGAHIFLPDAELAPENYSQFSSATYAIDEILRRMKMNGSCLTSLRAKVTGGANVLGTQMSIGERNAQSVLKELIDRRIFIAAKDLGGNYSRSAKFESDSGVMTVRISQINQYKTY